jgi:hypothetical protein
MNNCRKCDTKIIENYCSNCGESAIVKKLDFHYISHEIQHLFHLEKGFFLTTKELLIRPGKVVREYILEDRAKQVKPVIFLIFASLIFTIVVHYFHLSYVYVSINNMQLKEKNVDLTFVDNWLEAHLGYSNLICGLFIALGVKTIFRKPKYNIVEITVLLCYVIGEGMLISSVLLIGIGITKNLTIGNLVSPTLIIYTIWAIGQFYGERKIINYIKSSIAIVLGFLSFITTLLIIGTLIVKISHH